MRISEEHIVHPGAAFRFLNLDVNVLDAVRHRHRHVELTWVEQGTGLRFVGDSVLPFEAGDLVLIGANVPHAWVSVRQVGAARACVLQFPPELVEQGVLPELQALRPLLDRARYGVRIRGATHAAVTAALARLRHCDGLDRLACLMQVLHGLTLNEDDFSNVSRSVARAAPAGEREARLDKLTSWIHANLAQPIDVAQAAALVHVTPSAFARFFRREVGSTFAAYVNDVRCGQACVLLRASDRPIGLIAEACGFPTVSHFHREFSRRAGLTPLQYRRSHMLAQPAAAATRS